MAVFQITNADPNAFVFDLTGLANGNFVAQIFENAEGSTSRFGALRFALFSVNESAGQAEPLGSPFALQGDFPANFSIGIAPLADGGFVVLLTRIDFALPPQTTFIRFDAAGVEQGRTDVAASYTASPAFEATRLADEPLTWVRNNTDRGVELLSPETGLPTGLIDAHADVPLTDLHGLDGGLILRSVFDIDTGTRSFIADWMDDTITAPVPIYSSVPETQVNTTTHVATAGNQIVLASETLIFPADRDEVDVGFKLQMLLPNLSNPVTLLDELRPNEDNLTHAVELAEIPGIGFAYLRVLSSFSTRR